MSAKKKISVEEFDKLFDAGSEDIMDYLDLENAKHVNAPETSKGLNASFPVQTLRPIISQQQLTQH